MLVLRSFSYLFLDEFLDLKKKNIVKVNSRKNCNIVFEILIILLHCKYNINIVIFYYDMLNQDVTYTIVRLMYIFILPLKILLYIFNNVFLVFLYLSGACYRFMLTSHDRPRVSLK